MKLVYAKGIYGVESDWIRDALKNKAWLTYPFVTKEGLLYDVAL